MERLAGANAQAERRYVIQSVRYVKQALISSGVGLMEAEPEIAWLKPDIYVVNEDGDKPEKREFCAESMPNVISSRLEMLLERTSHE